MTSFVRYECLDKRRATQPTAAEAALKELLRSKRADRSRLTHASCDLRDLQSVRLLEQRKRRGAGELSTIALAVKIGQAVLSGDQVSGWPFHLEVK